MKLIEEVVNEGKWVSNFSRDAVKTAVTYMHRQSDLSFFLANRMGAPAGELDE